MDLLHTPTLTELRAVLGDDLLGLLHLYAGSLHSQVHDIREAHRHDDIERLRRCAHSLKGSSLSVGAQALAALAADIENLADAAGDPSQRAQLEQQVLALPALVEETLAALRAGGWVPLA